MNIPCELPYAYHVYHLYVVRVLYRFALQEALKRDGIQTGIHYPIPVHLQQAYADSRYRAGSFPIAEQATSEVLSLPMFAELSEEQIELTAMALQTAMSRL